MTARRSSPGGGARFAIAVALPLAMLALAYGLWAISDRLLYIGPLDRAAFGWTVVIPLTLLAPGLTGLWWSRLNAGTQRWAGLLVAGMITLAAAVLLAVATKQVRCEPVQSWMDVLPLGLLTGAVYAGSVVAAMYLAARTARYVVGPVWRPIATILAGSVAGFIGFWMTLLAWVVIFGSNTRCGLPTP